MANRLTHLLLIYHASISGGKYVFGNCQYATSAPLPLSIEEIRLAEAFIKNTTPDCKNAVLLNYIQIGQGAM